jgi:sugar phosphate isomerase/epimerase
MRYRTLIRNLRKAIREEAKELKRRLDGEGIAAEMVAPRLWFSPNTIDGAYTSNDPKARQYAIDRSLRSIDIARILGTNLLVLWLAREGTYLREAKVASRSFDLLVEAFDRMLAHDPEIRLAIEPKPNEPMDHAYVPTIGHALAIAQLTRDPARVGALIESAHAILAGLDPSDEIEFALRFGKLWSLHLNDQNGLKFDQTNLSAAPICAVPSTRCRRSNATATGATASMSVSTCIRFGPQSPSNGFRTSKTAGALFCDSWRRRGRSTMPRRSNSFRSATTRHSTRWSSSIYSDDIGMNAAWRSMLDDFEVGREPVAPGSPISAIFQPAQGRIASSSLRSIAL